MQLQVCPYCGKRTLLKRYCAYCGKEISKFIKCNKCNVSIPKDAINCPFCDMEVPFFNENFEYHTPTRFELFLAKFRPTIFLIFLLSIYTIIQLSIAILFYFIFPGEINRELNITTDLSMLLIMIISNFIMIMFITKILSFNYIKEDNYPKKILNPILIIVTLILAVSLVEILTTASNFLLDYLGVSPIQKSPYDDFFEDPLTIFAFMILATSVGPILEELIYRKYAISTMSRFTKSKSLLTIISALIFSFSHISADMIRGSLRYTILHLIAVCILGIILGIIYLEYGLKKAIIFHSLWNFFSLVMQLLVKNELLQTVDLILTFFIGITLICLIVSIYKFRNYIKKVSRNTFLLSKNNLQLILSNFILISVYNLSLAFIQIIFNQNIGTAAIILFFNVCGIILGLMLINKENQMIINAASSTVVKKEKKVN